MKTTNYCTIFRTDLLNGVYYLNTSNADLLLPTASSQLVHNWTFSFAENHFPQCRQFWADCEKTQVPMWPKIDMFHFLSTSRIKFNNRIDIGDKSKQFQTTYKFIFQYIYCMVETGFIYSAPVAVLDINEIQKSYRFTQLINAPGCDCILCTVNSTVQNKVNTHNINNRRIILFVFSLEIKINSSQELQQINKTKFLFLNETKISFDKAMSTNSSLNPLAKPGAPSQAIPSSHCPIPCASLSIGLLQSSSVLATVRLEGPDSRSDTNVSKHHSSTTFGEQPRYSVVLAATTSAVIISSDSNDANATKEDDESDAGLFVGDDTEEVGVLFEAFLASLVWLPQELLPPIPAPKLGILPRAAAAVASWSDNGSEQHSIETAKDIEIQIRKLQDKQTSLSPESKFFRQCLLFSGVACQQRC